MSKSKTYSMRDLKVLHKKRIEMGEHMEKEKMSGEHKKNKNRYFQYKEIHLNKYN